MRPGLLFSETETRGGHYSGLTLARNIYNISRHLPLIALTNINNADARSWFDDKGYKYFLKSTLTAKELSYRMMALIGLAPRAKPKCFIVHGHDHDTLADLKKYIVDQLSFSEPIILS